MTKFQKKYSIYKIKKGDALATVAAFFEKTEQEIKNFHNIFCKDGEEIKLDFPENLKQLYLYPNLHFEATGLAPYLDTNFYLKQNPPKAVHKYSVQYNYTEAEKSTITNFDISITFKSSTNKGYLFEIDKISVTEINGEANSNDTEEVKEKLLNIVYPLQVLVAENGSWQEVIYDVAIKKRFEKVKNELLNCFKGQTVTNLINHAEKKIVDKVDFKNLFVNNWLLDVFFSNLYCNYSNDSTEKMVHFAVLKNIEPQQFNVLQTASNFNKEKKWLTITKKGTLNDSRNGKQLAQLLKIQNNTLTNDATATGHFEQNNILNLETFALETLHLRTNINLEVSYGLEINIKRF